MKNKNILAGEAQTLNELLRRTKEASVYTYVMLEKIIYNDERMDDKKFSAWCRTFNQPQLRYYDLRTSYIEIVEDRSKGFPLIEEEIEIVLNRKKPEPVKVYKNVNLSANLDHPEQRLIHTVTEEAKKNNYELVVEKGENTVNYFLYNRKEYYAFKDNLIKPLLEKCKQWNDEEYINLFIQLNTWKRKEVSTEAKKIISYYSEIKGQFDIWYMENNYGEPKVIDKILELRINCKELIRQVLEIKSEVTQLNKDKEDLERQFENDVPDFPIDLKEKYDKIENEIEIRNKRIYKIEKDLFGTLEPFLEGLIKKHDRWVEEYKRIAIDDDKKYNELSKKSSYNKIIEIQQEIKKKAPEIKFTEEELLDLTITILGESFVNDDQLYKEIMNEEDGNDNLSKTIDVVLREKYDIVQNQSDGIVENEGLAKGSGGKIPIETEQDADEENKKKINLKKETIDFATELMNKKEINIDDYNFVSKMKVKVFAYLKKEKDYTPTLANKEAIRTYLSKFKQKLLVEQKKSSIKKRKKKLKHHT